MRQELVSTSKVENSLPVRQRDIVNRKYYLENKQLLVQQLLVIKTICHHHNMSLNYGGARVESQEPQPEK